MKPVAWSLKMHKTSTRVNAPTTFSTIDRANEYADQCAVPDVCIPNPVRPEVVALYHEEDVQSLQAERDRLREALVGVLSLGDVCLIEKTARTITKDPSYISEAFDIARKALEGIGG
jgi:hypothetical protein